MSPFLQRKRPHVSRLQKCPKASSSCRLADKSREGRRVLALHSPTTTSQESPLHGVPDSPGAVRARGKLRLEPATPVASPCTTVSLVALVGPSSSARRVPSPTLASRCPRQTTSNQDGVPQDRLAPGSTALCVQPPRFDSGILARRTAAQRPPTRSSAGTTGRSTTWCGSRAKPDQTL
jgi:hypothetical protein